MDNIYLKYFECGCKVTIRANEDVEGKKATISLKFKLF